MATATYLLRRCNGVGQKRCFHCEAVYNRAGKSMIKADTIARLRGKWKTKAGKHS